MLHGDLEISLTEYIFVPYSPETFIQSSKSYLDHKGTFPNYQTVAVAGGIQFYIP